MLLSIRVCVGVGERGGCHGVAWYRLGAVASTQLLGAQDAGCVRKLCPTRVLWKLLCLLTLVKKMVCVCEISNPAVEC